jgi:hypothetical protein
MRAKAGISRIIKITANSDGLVPAQVIITSQ